MLGILLLLVPRAASAAETSAPSSTEAGPEERRFRRRAGPREPPTPVTPAIDDHTPPYLEPPAVPEGRAFFVKTIRLEGSLPIPLVDVRPLLARYEGRELTLADLRQLAVELTQELRGRGYVTSRVYLPSQEVTGGVVTIQVLEGRVGAIRVEGARFTPPDTLTRRMRTTSGAPLDYRRLQRDLLRLNANQDRQVAAVLVPGEATGTTDIILRIQDQSPFHAGVVAHNTGTRLAGRDRQGVVIGHSNLTGHDDQLIARVEISERASFAGGGMSYLFPWGASGRTLGLDVSHANVLLGRHLRPRDIEGRATIIGATWAEPLWRTDHWEMEWVTGFDAKRIRSRELGSDRGKDDLRVLRLGPNVLEQDPFGRSILTTELGLGLSRFLGGSRKVDPSASRAQTGGQFVRFTIAGGRIQRLWRRVQLLVRGSWQWTDDRLPPAEMVQIGGVETVRGYPQGEFLGDYGYTGSLELRVPLPLPRRSPDSSLTVVGFLDGGAAFVRHPRQAEDEKKRLIGVGVGLRWRWSPTVAALLDIGFPVGETSSEGDRLRVYYSINVGF